MLQQTQVATVQPAYERFMTRFPDCAALAAAPIDDVLGLWSGLGYYARARNLHLAAQRIAVEGFPDDVERLMRLPGIGRSTAAAIVSLTWDRPAAILDGNVRRVLARHAGIEGWPGDPVVSRSLWAEAERRLPAAQRAPGDAAAYTQGLMDLGALRCHRRRPACEACPVAADCAARLAGQAEQWPAPRPPRVRPQRQMALVLDCGADGVVLTQRPTSGIWGGLWCLPEGEAGLPWCVVRHDLTHLRLDLAVTRGSLDPCDARHLQHFDWQRVWTLGLPQPVRHLLERAYQELVR